MCFNGSEGQTHVAYNNAVVLLPPADGSHQANTLRE